MKTNTLAEAEPVTATRHELPHIMTTADVATVLVCSKRHVANLTQRGVLRAIRLGRSVRYTRQSLLRALARLDGGES